MDAVASTDFEESSFCTINFHTKIPLYSKGSNKRMGPYIGMGWQLLETQ